MGQDDMGNSPPAPVPLAPQGPLCQSTQQSSEDQRASESSPLLWQTLVPVWNDDVWKHYTNNTFQTLGLGVRLSRQASHWELPARNQRISVRAGICLLAVTQWSEHKQLKPGDPEFNFWLVSLQTAPRSPWLHTLTCKAPTHRGRACDVTR